jgi:DNA-binding SARP family transcriptional activator
MGGVDAMRYRVGVALPATHAAERARLTAIARASLGAEFDRLYESGRHLSMEAVVSLATYAAGEHTAEYRVPTLDGAGGLPHAQRPAPPATTLKVLALGTLQVFIGDEAIDVASWGSARTRELLVYLLVHSDGRTKEQVGLAFWPEASSAQLRNNFHVTLHRLRKALRNPDWVLLANDRYRIDPAIVREFDVAEFEREVVAGRRALRLSRDGAAAALERALTRFRGDFLDGESVGDWHNEVRDRMQRLYVDACLDLGTAYVDEENWAKAAETYRRILARDEIHEEAARALMTCLVRLGERTQSLRLYQRLSVRLRQELDADPDEETTALYERVQRGEGF